jgi:hypothetical protein
MKQQCYHHRHHHHHYHHHHRHHHHHHHHHYGIIYCKFSNVQLCVFKSLAVVIYGVMRHFGFFI